MTALFWLALAAALLLLPAPSRRSGRRRAAAGGSPGLPLTLDLIAAVLQAGRPFPAAVEAALPDDGVAAADSADATLLRRVARLIRLGADPDEAWQAVPAGSALAALAVRARRSAVSGARLAHACTETATALRAAAQVAALARARRAGVLAIAPLGLCFLPAFVCLGVVPMVLTIARSALPALG